MKIDRTGWQGMASRALALAQIICEALASKVALGAGDQSVLIVAPLYAKAYQSFMSVLELEKVGLVEDAFACLRSCAESAMAMIAVSDDKSFINRLVSDHHFQRQSYAQKIFDSKATRETLTSDEKERLASAIDEHRSEISKRLNWEEVPSFCKTAEARAAVTALYLVHHRASGARIHVGLDSLENFVDVSADPHVTKLKWMPSAAGSSEVLKSGCDVMFYAMISSAHFLELVELQGAARKLHAEYRAQLE